MPLLLPPPPPPAALALPLPLALALPLLLLALTLPLPGAVRPDGQRCRKRATSARDRKRLPAAGQKGKAAADSAPSHPRRGGGGRRRVEAGRGWLGRAEAGLVVG